MADNQITAPEGPMEIVPHEPVMHYTVEGYPLSSMDAFIVYANGTEIYSLTTDNKTIVGAINELKAQIAGIDLSDYATIAMLEDYAKLSDLDNYVTVDVFNETVSTVNNLSERLTTAESNISNLQSEVSDIKDRLPNAAIQHVLTTFTNPSYFTAKNSWGEFTTDNYITFSCDVNVMQSIQLEDGILEVLNINYLRNVVLDFEKMPTHFYVPATVDYYDDNGVYTMSKHFTLDCEWTTEANSFDLSVYFRGEIPDVNDNTVMKISAMIPYSVTEGVTIS